MARTSPPGSASGVGASNSPRRPFRAVQRAGRCGRVGPGVGARGGPAPVGPGEDLVGEEAAVEPVGLLALVGRALAHVLHGQGGDDHLDLAQAVAAGGLDEHAPQPRVDGHLGQSAPGAGEARGAAVGALEGAELVEQAQAVGDLGAVGRLDEGEVADVAELGAGHPEDDRGEVGAQDLGLGELGPRQVVLLRVEAEAHAGPDAAAPPGALVGARAADGLDGQPLHLRARRVPRDAGQAGVDDEADAGHRERGLGDVGGQDDAPGGVRGEDAVLLGRGQAREERQHLGARPEVGRGERGRGVLDLALAGQEDEDVAARPELAHGGDDGGRHVGVVALVRGPVADLDRPAATGDLDDGRRGPVGAGEVLGETGRVDRRRGDDDPELGTRRQQLLEVAEQEVDGEAALVGLVDDDRVVAAQPPVVVDLGEQNAVGHDLDPGPPGGPAREAHLVADGVPQTHAHLVGEALGDGAGGDAPRLGVADAAPAQPQADLGKLGGLPRAGLAGHDDDLVVPDEPGDLVGVGADRQGGVDVEERLVGDGLLARIGRVRHVGSSIGAPRGARLRPARGRGPRSR